jgi:CheY-like chemotaxis protein
MTTTVFSPPFSAPIPSGDSKKKRLLLVDTSPAKRDLRAEVMRKLGIEVDCAADIGEARSWWRADLYDLVLINMEKGMGHRDKFCEDIRTATPPQQLAFLVGKPEYLADLPNADGEPALQMNDGEVLIGDATSVRSTELGYPPQRWGILEASRQISAVRAQSNARVRAMRDRPAPPRDSEMRPSRRTTTAVTLDELLREEMQ